MNGRRFDDDARRRGKAAVVIGVDEAGRGPLAGPVVVAAVALPEVCSADFVAVRDSKLLTPKARERLFGVICSQAVAVSIAWAHPPVIDRKNILRATLLAMRRAARRAAGKLPSPALVLIDGPHRAPRLGLAQLAVIDGDNQSLSVGAASIVAKVLRDRWMERIERKHPGYGFAIHKGYGTKAHGEALTRLGPCRAHRRSYAPVAAAGSRA